MKACVDLWLLLLVSLMWTCSGQGPVLVECSHFNFLTVAKRALFYRDELGSPDELFLGTGCQAIRVRPDELEFYYPVSLCGIVTQVFFDGVVFHSWLAYTPKNLSISAKLRLECTVPSSYVSPGEFFYYTEESKNFIPFPPAQRWFLIQSRYCVRCGYVHFGEHWYLMQTIQVLDKRYLTQKDLQSPIITLVLQRRYYAARGGYFYLDGATEYEDIWFNTILVYIRCSPSLFLARIKPTAFHNDLPMASDEVFLGDQCPVTSVHQGFYEFQYHPRDCNIRIEVLPGDRILFVSEIIFMSKFSDLEASIPVACVVPRHPAPIRITTGNDANKQGGLKRSPGIANLYSGETVNRKEKNNYVDAQFCYLKKNHTARLSPPANLEGGYEPL